MINLPILDDRFDVRVAGEWTKRDGYTTNTLTGNQVDGRDLWSSRVSVAWKPLEHLKATLVWEHFQENDDRMRTAKQLCHTDPGPTSVDGIPVYPPGVVAKSGLGAAFTTTSAFFSQGCLPASLYAPESFQVPNGFALPMVTAGWISGGIRIVNPYANAIQSTNLRNIETTIDPRYTAKNNTVELNVDYNVTPALTFTSQTGFNQDFLWSTEDYNRFNTAANLFIDRGTGTSRADTLVAPNGNFVCNDGTISIGGDNCLAGGHGAGIAAGDFCDPQLGCSSRLVAQDISEEHAWQASQEFRLASNFSGPFNFSVGGNYLHYETEENYFVLSNMLTMFAATSGIGPSVGHPWVPGVTTNLDCFHAGNIFTNVGRDYRLRSGVPTESCYYIDPNPLESVNDLGHNYFLSQNPYTLNSYAGFGEAYYNILPELKLTGGLRWTDDKKHFVNIPSELFTASYGYFSSGDVDQRWSKFTGRFAANWTPKLDFTDQTLLYGSFSHGYKAGGANPPGAVLTNYYGDAGTGVPIHPATFDPEYIDAYELGTKNTLANGALTLNGNMFFYNYTGYQISEIVDRTSINLNFNATVKGAELEATYEPVPGLRFNFAGGYEQTRIKNGQSAIDLMDRTAGHSDWMLMKPFPTQASNCVFPDYVVAALVLAGQSGGQGTPYTSACGLAYNADFDPVLQSTYYYNDGAPYAVHDPHCGSCYSGPYPVTIGPTAPQYAGYTFTYPGFDPRAGTSGDPYQGQNTYNGHDYGPAPNNGEGFAKDLGGNELPNAPHFTVSASVDYTIPVTPDWASTFHVDYYWQDYSWARVFNDNPYDRLRGYTNINLALILTSQNGWQVMGYLKNVFNVTDVTGAFLNSDDSGLTTNIFLTDPRLFGLRVTKNW
jgi:outer membrane receptor protein involved in Fe transport